MHHFSLFFAAALVLPALVWAQVPAPAPPESPQVAARLRVFLDCEQCFADFLRSEISWVDFVRDAADADVHLIARDQETGGGGREYVLRFVGAGKFQGTDRDLRVLTVNGDPEDVRRRAALRTITVGLLDYLALGGLPIGLDVSVREAQSRGADRQSGSDPWNYWVFSVRGGGSYQAEQTSRETEWQGGATGDRVTENWKVSFGLDIEQRQERFDLDEDQPLEVTRRSREFEWFAAKSLGPHWSAGADGQISSSTFGNTRFSTTVGPAVEYSIFPYKDYASRQVLLQYQVGVEHAKYNEVTLFDKLRETLGRHQAALRFDQRQPWGSVQASLEWSQYLHDRSKHRLELNSDISLRLTRGLSVNFEADASRIHDQLSLPRRSASAEEVLLRLRQLQSSFEVDLQIGITYSFGSLFNNVVNPRFRR